MDGNEDNDFVVRASRKGVYRKFTDYHYVFDARRLNKLGVLRWFIKANIISFRVMLGSRNCYYKSVDEL
ncbi:MAG TPA: hypothetical protein VI790_05855 [Candidatus Nanoarchaeia archaeon]|nr:hypothetical protein [Candidatus Nanoarchaeia archaeon]